MKISVVMAVYNAQKYLDEAIKSILNQTFTDFEFIIINDASTDESLKIIEKYQKQDARIVVINSEKNNLIKNLNAGINQAKGEYIARMDADDISLPMRFEEIMKHIEANNLDICGSAMQLFNANGNIKIIDFPRSDADIKFRLMFRTAFSQPSVLIKKQVFERLSYQDYPYAEDYKLWSEIALNNFKMGNIEQVLLKYRIHQKQVSAEHTREQAQLGRQISANYLAKSENSEKIGQYFEIFGQKPSVNIWKKLCSELLIYQKKQGVSDEYFAAELRYILRNSAKINLAYFAIYKQATANIKTDFLADFYLFIQCFLLFKSQSKLYKLLLKLHSKLHLKR